MNIKQLIYDKVVYPLFKDQIEITTEHLKAGLNTAYTYKAGLLKAVVRDKMAEVVKIELGFDPTESREAMIKAGLLIVNPIEEIKVKTIEIPAGMRSKILGEGVTDALYLRTAPPYGGPDYSTSLKLRSDLNA